MRILLKRILSVKLKVMEVLTYNRKAKFDYDILETFEAGLVLKGHEVKSIKTGHVSLKGSYVSVISKKSNLPELYLIKAHISLYKQAGNVKDYDPERPRKLLLKKNEIKHLIGKKQEQGLTLVPLKIYTKHNFIKMEFGIGRGKKKYDKREDIKKREVGRKLNALTKMRMKS